MLIPRKALEECIWWRKNVKESDAIFIKHPTTLITTDASDTGWGAQIRDTCISGPWRKSQRYWHVNMKELYTIWIVLNRFKDELKGKTVMIQSDNKTVVAHIRKQGGTKSLILLEATKKLLIMAREFRILIHPFYILGRYDCIADRLFINLPMPDWHVLSSITEIIFEKWGIPEIDLFTTNQSAVVPNYASLNPKDSRAVFHSAFSQTWTYHLAWVFPPPTLIPRLLQHLNHATGTYLLVAPRWEKVYWRGDLRIRTKDQPFMIKNLGDHRIDGQQASSIH
ncbi:unnamed protein product [Parnassius mnemosyne]|uniref:Reverse transcriptase RNase H-like domain-containing protein n=1 Tax=Parnassius mnemosyne TaxID=213953 RepID=A0AAV1MB56_9NEOP